jgi:hypothetical protein
LVDVLTNSLNRQWEAVYGRKCNIQFYGNGSGGHSCSQHANYSYLKTAHFIVAFVPSTRCTGVMVMLFNQLLDMLYLSGGWFILAKEKCSLTGM